MNRIIIEAVLQASMRAPYDKEVAAGDWFINEDGDLVIRSIGTDFDDADTFLFALHELIEARLCRARGISQETVDRFDEAYETLDHDPDAEPGDHPASPYRKEHRFACLIEFLMAHELGVSGYGTMR